MNLIFVSAILIATILGNQAKNIYNTIGINLFGDGTEEISPINALIDDFFILILDYYSDYGK